jgi:predicted DNA-binding transcriptional regulator AlpA
MKLETLITNDVAAGFWARSGNMMSRSCAAMVTEREYLNGKALCQYLGVSEMTLHRWRFGYTVKRRGVVVKTVLPVDGFPRPAVGFGNPLWSRTEIDAFLLSRKAA